MSAVLTENTVITMRTLSIDDKRLTQSTLMTVWTNLREKRRWLATKIINELRVTLAAALRITLAAFRVAFSALCITFAALRIAFAAFIAFAALRVNLSLLLLILLLAFLRRPTCFR